MKTQAQRRTQKKKQKFERQFHSQERVEFFRRLPCELTGTANQSHNAHMKSRGAGGSYKDIVPLQFMAHKDFDEMPNEKFEAKYKRTKQSVKDKAPAYHQLWKERRR